MYEFDEYHLLLGGLGAAIVLSYWFPRFLSGREPAASALLIIMGVTLLSFVPGVRDFMDPTQSPRIWEVLAELCVIIGLFGTGLRIDHLADRKQWQPTIRLLAIAMPMTIVAVALFGWAAAGMTLAGGILLGAILAPTDPVLAGDVQVGPPQEGGEHPVRYTLTKEAGLNDGLAFPFVHLGILVATVGGISLELGGEWLLRDVFYRIIVGALMGVGVGWTLGKLLFDWPRENALSKTGSGVIALAGVLLAYGSTELVEGYGFIAAFVSGLTLRRAESRHQFHRRLHDFSESLEHALTSILLIALGAVLPVLWPYLGWPQVLIAVALIFVIRPLAGWLSLIGSALRPRERMIVAFYGVRGIGSIYYLAYAGHHIELVDEEQLWATIAFTILLSTIVHGLTAGIAVERVTGEPQAGPSPPQRSAE